MIRPFLALVTLAAFGACSSDTRDGPEAGPLAKVEGFCAEWAERACNDTVVSRCAATDAEDCQAAQSDFCLDLVPGGTYSATTADECLDAVEAAYEDAELTAEERDTVRLLGSPCDLIVAGPAGAGEACTETADCNTDAELVCVIKPEGGGTCQEATLIEPGRDCSAADALCEDGFYCDGSNCIENKKEGASCSDEIPCSEEFKCERADGTPPLPDADDATCIARVAVGETCEKNIDCLSNICVEGATESVCVETILLSATDPFCDDLR